MKDMNVRVTTNDEVSADGICLSDFSKKCDCDTLNKTSTID